MPAHMFPMSICWTLNVHLPGFITKWRLSGGDHSFGPRCRRDYFPSRWRFASEACRAKKHVREMAVMYLGKETEDQACSPSSRSTTSYLEASQIVWSMDLDHYSHSEHNGRAGYDSQHVRCKPTVQRGNTFFFPDCRKALHDSSVFHAAIFLWCLA